MGVVIWECYLFCKLCECPGSAPVSNDRVSIDHKFRPNLRQDANSKFEVFKRKIFANFHTLRIKMTPKPIMLKSNAT